MGETTVAEAEKAMRKLKVLLENTDFHHLFAALDAATDETEAFIVLASELLTPLAGECLLSAEYQPLCQRNKSKLKTAHLGMGSTHTWHGYPDARCYTVDMVSSTNFDFWDEWECSSAPIDGTYHVLCLGGLNQVTGHAVVTSFIHHNQFQDKHHLLPALLINSVQAAFAFYDAEFDVCFL